MVEELSLEDIAEKVLGWVKNVPVLAYDTEGSGLDWKRNLPVGYVFTVESDNGYETYYVPVRHGGGANLFDANCPPLETPEGPFVKHWFEDKLDKAFIIRSSKGYVTVGHNMKFDVHFSWSAGVNLPERLECTQNIEALLDEHAAGFSLDACAKRRKGKVPFKLGDELYHEMARMFGGKPERDQMGNFWRLPGMHPLGYEYAAQDGITTLALWKQQMAEVEEFKEDYKHDLTDIIRLENDLIYIVAQMERTGIKVDLDYFNKLKADLEAEVAEIIKSLPEGFNPRSSTHMRKLCEAAGRTDWPLTEKKNPSFTEKFLKSFPEGENVIKLRQMTNLINSFINPVLQEHVFNGRVHTNLMQLKMDEYGTISGRFSSTLPNMQAVPKHNKQTGPKFRKGFVADDGYLLCEADQSQAEPRLFAHYSREPFLVDGYNMRPFRDMHDATATLLNVDRGTTGKRMNMGLLTGMQVPTFSMHMGWPKSQAQEMFDKWNKAYPGIHGFQQDAKAVMLKRGFVKTLYGRVCRLDDRQFAYKATSRIIQGGNADIVKYKLRQAWNWIKEKGYDIRLVLTVHDSFLFLFPNSDEGKKQAKEFVMMLADVQSPPFNLRVPFCMDAGWGLNWAEATYGDEGVEGLHADGWHK